MAVARGDRRDARYDMSIGSLYAGISLANAGVGAVHALAYPLGGQFNVPHGIANGILLPHVMEFNVPGDIAKFAEVAGLLGERVESLSPVEAVKNLLRDVDMPTTLTELNIPRSAIPEMAAASINVTRLMGNNPRRMTAKDSEKVYEKAF